MTVWTQGILESGAPEGPQQRLQGAGLSKLQRGAGRTLDSPACPPEPSRAPPPPVPGVLSGCRAHPRARVWVPEGGNPAHTGCLQRREAWGGHTQSDRMTWGGPPALQGHMGLGSMDWGAKRQLRAPPRAPLLPVHRARRRHPGASPHSQGHIRLQSEAGEK